MKEKEILRHTSRTFFLTLRLLPQSVRPDATLGYMLARATDTLADTSAAEPALRLELLRSARASLGQIEIPGFVPDEWTVHQRDPAEARLLGRLPALWRRMHGLEASARARLELLMGKILEGQIFDLERFGPEASPVSDEEIERYTYLVAGSVGEFWTQLCEERIPGFADLPADAMLARGRRYGQGLQLVNILRDRRMDAVLGRVYVRADDAPRWTATARRWLAEGAHYCKALPSGRLRYATLLPALLGWRTLSLVETGEEGLLAPRKIPRAELRRWMRRAIAVWWSPRAVDRLAREARGPTFRAER